MTAEFEGEENPDSSESANLNIFDPLDDAYTGSIKDSASSNIYGDDLRSEAATVVKETKADEGLATDSQSRIWDREDEMELQVIKEEDQKTKKKKDQAKRK